MADRAGIANEVVGAAIANKVTQAGAATGLAGWLVSVNWIGWAGVAIALAGFSVNLYFQRRRDQREQAESAARIEALRGRCDV